MHEGFCTEKFQWGKYFGTSSWEREKSSVFLSVSGSLHWMPRVCWEKPGGLYLQLRPLCSLHGVHRFPSWSVGLCPERPRWGYNHCSVVMGLDQQGGLIIKQPCLYGHFPLGNCPENTNLLHRKYQLGVHHHPWALAICIFECELRARFLGKAYTILWSWKILSEFN